MRKRSQEEVVKEVNELTNGFYGTEKLIYTGVDNCTLTSRDYSMLSRSM